MRLLAVLGAGATATLVPLLAFLRWSAPATEDCRDLGGVCFYGSADLGAKLNPASTLVPLAAPTCTYGLADGSQGPGVCLLSTLPERADRISCSSYAHIQNNVGACAAVSGVLGLAPAGASTAATCCASSIWRPDVTQHTQYTCVDALVSPGLARTPVVIGEGLYCTQGSLGPFRKFDVFGWKFVWVPGRGLQPLP